MMSDKEKIFSLREAMVRDQLQGRGIKDKKVLDAFLSVPREEFVPEQYRGDAYGDCPIPIGEGQTISQPYMVAIMTELLSADGAASVLEIGTGSGYQAAILSKICKQVYTIERIKVLAQRAESVFKKLGYDNISVNIGDGSLGLPEFSPYSGIIVSCGAPSIPEPLKEQLRAGARLVIPLGQSISQVLTIITKGAKGFEVSNSCGCMFVPLVGKHGWGA